MSAYETRRVLAGAYKAGRERKVLLTHLTADGDTAVCRSTSNLVDSLGMTEEGLRARPTCPRCAARWDRLQALEAELAADAAVEASAE